MKGQRSELDPGMLPPGYFQLIEQLRFFRRSVFMRWGCLELTSGPVVANANYRGHRFLTINGTEVCVAAYWISGGVNEMRLYRVNFGVNPMTFTEISSAAAPDTRWSTDYPVTIEAVRELGLGDGIHNGQDYIYISNGVDAVCWNGVSALCLPLTDYDASTMPTGTYRPIPRGYFNVNDPALTTLSDSGANVTIVDLGLSPVNEIQIDFTTAAVVGNWAQIDFAALSCVNISGSTETAAGTLDASQSDELWLVLHDSASDPITNYLDIEVSGGGTFLYESGGANRLDPASEPLGGGYNFTAIKLPGSLISSLGTLGGIRFRVRRPFTANRTFKVAGIMVGGQVAQGCQYVVSYANAYSRHESKGVLLNGQNTAALSEYGCPRTLSTKLPEVDKFTYQYRIDWGGVTPHVDVDEIYLYRLEPGDFEPLFAIVLPISNRVTSDNTKSQDRAIFRPAPSAAGRGPKACRSGLWNAERFHYGAVSDGRNQVWSSDKAFPWRLRAVATDEDGDFVPDSTSGTSVSFPGMDVTAIKAMPGSFVGSAPQIIFTSRNVYRQNANDAAALSSVTLMNEHGCIHPNTIVAHRGLLYYTDLELIARRFAGGLDAEALSLGKISDEFEAGDLSSATAVMYQEIYKLAFRGPGHTSNRRVANCITEEGDEWCFDSYDGSSNHNWAGYSVQGTGSGRRLLGFTNEGRIFEVERPGQLTDAGSPIILDLISGHLNDDMWTEAKWGDLGVVCDRPAGGSMIWDVEMFDPMDAANPSVRKVGTIDVGTAPKSSAYRLATADGYPMGLDSPTCVYRISGPYTPGLFLKTIAYEKTSYGKDNADAA